MTTAFDIIGSNKALQDHWLRRFVAIIIDGIIASVIVFAISIFFWILAPWGFIGWFFTGAIMLLYFILFEMIMGGTPGKKLLSLEVVKTDGQLDFISSLLRNISKIFWIFLLIDWFIGMFTDGDPRQKWLDRYANTTVQRTDSQAYMEQQFKQMAFVPPHPTYQPPPGQQQYQAPPQPQQPVQQQPAQGAAWPHQEQTQPKSDWPQHDPGAAPPQQQAPPPQQQAPPPQQQPPPQQPAQQPPPGGAAPRFCQNCGNTLSPGPDGRPTCSKCGARY